jgi:hypothetical protein
MKLPHADQAIVDQAKISEYLLSPDHPQGSKKARYFEGFGFQSSQPDLLSDALKSLASSGEVSRVRQTGFGPCYAVEGNMVTPDGRNPRVRSVWMVDEGGVAPRLITAYPTGE